MVLFFAFYGGKTFFLRGLRVMCKARGTNSVQIDGLNRLEMKPQQGHILGDDLQRVII